MDILCYPVLVQAGSKHSVGSVALGLDLLKPWRVFSSANAYDAQVSPALHGEHSHHPSLMMPPRSTSSMPTTSITGILSCSGLHWLPIKLAKWIGEYL